MRHQRARFDGMSPDQVHRFVGGRRAYNRRRQDLALLRRLRVAELLSRTDIGQRGWRAAIAAELGVHRATVTRDIRQLRAEYAGDARINAILADLADRCRLIRMMDDADLRRELAQWQAEVRRAAQ